MQLYAELGADVVGERPFLAVVTRCYKRPTLLKKNIDSLHEQTDQDYEQIFLVDDRGIGLHGANRSLALAKPTADYVMILDDDDLLTDPQAIALLKHQARTRPDVIMFRCDHADLGILPTAAVWERGPRRGEIGSCDFVTRLDVWQRHICSFGTPIQGDYAFLAEIWANCPEAIWLDRQLTAVQRISRGAPE